MLESLTLKCESCGADLNITSEMDRFACGFCGASQVVNRSGGTVSLKLVTDAIRQVQTGTDKTAAELAIRRLKEEKVELDIEYKKIKDERDDELNTIQTGFSVGFVVLILIVIAGLANSQPSVLIFFFPVIIVMGIAFAKSRKSIKLKYQPEIESLIGRFRSTNTRIAEQKAIVDN